VQESTLEPNNQWVSAVGVRECEGLLRLGSVKEHFNFLEFSRNGLGRAQGMVPSHQRKESRVRLCQNTHSQFPCLTDLSELEQFP